MADFDFVMARLATGAAIGSIEDVRALAGAGITHVIDCIAGSDDTPLLASSGMAYLWNGTEDDGQHKPASWFGTSLAFALPALAQPGTRVYAHCAAGVNRGPSTAYAILRALGLPATTAFGLVKSARPQVQVAYAADADAAVLSLGYG